QGILEKAGASAEEKREAAVRLARLHGLAGNLEKAAGYWDAAGKIAEKAAEGQRGTALLEKARLLIAQGEYEKAGGILGDILTGEVKGGFITEARFLSALVTFFRNGEEGPLARLAAEGDLGSLKSGLYYALWKFTGGEVWKTRLLAEYPASPEALILQGGPIQPAAAPLWFLFPGREGLSLSAPAGPGPAVPAAGGPAREPAAPAPEAGEAKALQVGLYGREENARIMAERLEKAGFTPSITVRKLEDRSYWAVIVPAGTDGSAAMMRLKDRGFESFPLF
ncbi:MAG: SPOR domain-containing protein, partial [Treponema sp.]|nr:SPOR domain-containing protein [Treponema sp.]